MSKPVYCYEFSFSDNEGDVYHSDECSTLSEVKEEWERVKEKYDGDCSIMESWIYKNGEYVGMWY
jgi:hypothetical protein